MNNNNEERTIPLVVAVIIVAIFIAIVGVLGYFVLKVVYDQPISIPYHVTPHLAIVGLFRDSQKMKGISRRILREQRRVATVRLFKGLIYFAIIVSILGLAISQLP